MVHNGSDYLVLPGTSNRSLAEKICDYLGVKPASAEISKFANDNTFVKINENIRKRDIFIIQSICRPTNDNLMELLIMVDAAKRASAKSITAVIPYFDYARSDKKDQPRVPITAKLIADMITMAGVNRVITMDLHAEQIQGFFNIPVDHLYAAPVMIEYLKGLHLGDFIIVAPDAGGAARARGMAKRVPTSLAIIDKRRVGNVDYSEVLNVVGDVKGKTCVLVDDIVDTAGTLVKAAKALKDADAKNVYAAITHPVLSRDAVEKIAASALNELIVTDTIPIPPENRIDKIRVLTVSSLLGETIKRVQEGESVSSLFV
ncbi:MAG: ribose-phosphate diphosphokinase [Candidatus Glassbacteria bacterium]